MGKGLAFLNKKKWHTGSFPNREKVWKREQDQLRMEKSKEESMKKLKDEMQIEELKKLQVKAGLISEAQLDRMTWMYEWGNKVQMEKKSQEDFLLGKKAVTQKDIANNNKVLKNNDQNNQSDQQFKFEAIYQETNVNTENQNFTLLHEDPLYQIQMEEHKRKQEILSNPIKMKELFVEIEQKKNRKQHKHKHNKKHKRERSRSRSSSKQKNKRNSNNENTPEQQSQFMKDYLKSRFGEVVVKDEKTGLLKPDFAHFKRKLNTSQLHLNNKTDLTLEEKKKFVEKMKSDAESLQKSKLTLHSQHVQEQQDAKHNTQYDAKFIRDMKKDVYSGEKSQEALADRIGRHRNTLQHI